MRTTTLTWISTTWSPSIRRCWSPSWTNSDSGHTHYWPSIQSNASGNGPKWFLAPKNHGFDTKIKSVACPEVELLHHEEVHHLFREVDHVVDTHGNVVVSTKRDHFSKYGPKSSNHAKFQLFMIKNKKVMAKKPLNTREYQPPLCKKFFFDPMCNLSLEMVEKAVKGPFYYARLEPFGDHGMCSRKGKN